MVEARREEKSAESRGKPQHKAYAPAVKYILSV